MTVRFTWVRYRGLCSRGVLAVLAIKLTLTSVEGTSAPCSIKKWVRPML